jgi:hypothetical protein
VAIFVRRLISTFSSSLLIFIVSIADAKLIDIVFVYWCGVMWRMILAHAVVWCLLWGGMWGGMGWGEIWCMAVRYGAW